jgi:hypothetical protein
MIPLLCKECWKSPETQPSAYLTGRVNPKFKTQKDYFDFSTIEPNIFVSSLASLIKFFFSIPSSSLGSDSSSQYALSFASFLDIFILITKSFLLNASSAFYPVK